MDLKTFYDKYNTGKPIANLQGTFPGECVSLIAHYLADGFQLYPNGWGNARDYWLNPKPAILTKFDKISTQSFRNGDIGIWDDKSHDVGHIAIYWGGQWINQNNANRKYETLDGIGLTNFLGVLRPKETNVVTTVNEIFYLRLGIYGSAAPVATNDPDVGKDYHTIVQSYLDYANKNGVAYWQYKAKADKQIADLKAQLDSGYIKVTDLYIKKEK